MTDITLPTDIAAQISSRIKLIDSVPESEKLNAFRILSYELARTLSRHLSRTEAADQLLHYAVMTGIVATCGDDAIQQVLHDAFIAAATIKEQCEEEELSETRPPEFSDEALALAFATAQRGELKYVAVWNKWLIWNRSHWKIDETLKIISLAREFCGEISKTCNQEKVAVSIASKKTIISVVGLARADRRIAATVDQWDANPWLLNTPSGTVDLRTGALRAHDPNDYLTKITTVGPDHLCPTPMWHAFLDRVCRRDVEFVAFLSRIAGYALTGETCEHALFFCYGAGANGKSTFLNTVIHCLGDYHRTAPIETFTASGGERHPTDLAGLRGARLVTSVETEEGRRWAEAKIKNLTGGDKISARFMRQDFFEYRPYFKLFIAGNHKPGLRSVDEANGARPGSDQVRANRPQRRWDATEV
jgi:putative DNA primase/helicase